MNRRAFLGLLGLIGCNEMDIKKNWWLGGAGASIDSDYANGSNEVLFIVQGDSTTLDSNNSTGAGPANNGKLWNGSSFASLGTVGPGVSTVDGSFLQQFALSYYTRTGKVACFVNSGVGGSKVFDTWNGVSSTYTNSMTQAENARVAGGFPKVRFLLCCLVNDSTAGDTLATVNANFNAWIDAILTTYPTTQIYYSMFGVKTGQTTRAQNLRCNVREKWIATERLHIAFSDLYCADWGLIGADGVHPTQTGHNFRGAKFDSYLGLDSSYSKFARTIINSQYSTWGTTRAEAVNTCISGLVSDGVWHNMVGYWLGDDIHANDRFVDWTLLSRLTDRGVTVNLDSNVETDTGKTLNIPITPTSIPWRTHSNTDVFLSIRVADFKSAISGTKILGGVSSGTNIFAMQMGATGTITFYCWSNSGPTKTGGFLDNTRYVVGRVAGEVISWINGTENGRTPVAAGSALTTGPEIGDRYTAGPAGFAVNTEIKDYCMGLASAVDQSLLHSRLETMYASI